MKSSFKMAKRDSLEKYLEKIAKYLVILIETNLFSELCRTQRNFNGHKTKLNYNAQPIRLYESRFQKSRKINEKRLR